MAEDLKRKTKVGLYWSFTNQVATLGMQFVVGIVMARILTPSDYGITALPAAFMSIAQVFIESGFSSALVRKPELKQEDLSTAFYYSFMVGVLCYIIMFFAAPFIADFYHEPVLIKLVRISSLVFIWSPLNTPQNVILQRKLDFKTPARIAIINKLISGALGILAAYKGFGLWALVIANLTSSILGFIQTWIAVKWVPKAEWSKDSFKYLWGYGNKLVATHLVKSIFSNIGSILMGKMSGTANLGYYDRAKGYANIPSANITGVITSVTFPVLSKFQHDDDLLRRNYIKMIRVSSFVIFPVMMLLAALAHPLIIIMLTDKWEYSAYLLQIICFTYMWQPVQILNLNVLQVKGRPDLTLKLEMIKRPLSLAMAIVGLSISVEAFCYADLLFTFIALVLNTYYTKKLVDVGLIKQIKDLLPVLLLSSSMFVLVIFVTQLIENLYLQVFIGGFVGVAFYLIMAIVFRFKELPDVLYLLKIKK